MTITTNRLALTIALGMVVVGCKNSEETPSNSEAIADPTPVELSPTPPSPPTAMQETEPLAFRIDGMKRVNGAL